MEKRIEKWESLRLEAQEFTPQDYVAVCEWLIRYESHAGEKFLPSDKFYKDTDEDEATMTASIFTNAANTYNYDNTIAISSDPTKHAFYYWFRTDEIKQAVLSSSNMYETFCSYKPDDVDYVVGNLGNNGGQHVAVGRIVQYKEMSYNCPFGLEIDFTLHSS